MQKQCTKNNKDQNNGFVTMNQTIPQRTNILTLEGVECGNNHIFGHQKKKSKQISNPNSKHTIVLSV